MRFNIEYTDTFGGEANYSWCRRATISMPDITHYGYDGCLRYGKAQKSFERELMRRAKSKMGLTGVRGIKTDCGDILEFRPYGMCTVMFITEAAE